MKSKTETLLITLKVLAWIVCIGPLIKAGSIVVSYFVSTVHSIAARDLYRGMDLSGYKSVNFLQYSFMVWYNVVLFLLQANIAYLIIKLLSTQNITRPFNIGVVKLLQRISYSILIIWIVAMVHNIHAAILERTNNIEANYISGESIFLAGIVYILAEMFKRGIQIQSENELTF